MKTSQTVSQKSMDFAIRIIMLYRYLCEDKREFILSKQLLRSGTSIGANIREGKYAQSSKDFISKHSIALKEAGETEYWLELLHKTNYISDVEFESIHEDCTVLIKMLTSIVKATKKSH